MSTCENCGDLATKSLFDSEAGYSVVLCEQCLSEYPDGEIKEIEQ